MCKRRFSKQACFVLVLIVLSARSLTAAPQPEEIIDLFAASEIRGAAVVYALGDEEERLFMGYGDAAGSVPIDSRTRFRAGSVSKLLTSLLVLRAVEAGLLGLEDSIGRWLPGSFRDRPEVEIQHLLEHTAGLSGSTYAEYGEQAPGLSPG
ncbi:MAG: serine hydrolase domain-containing protein, partial [Verrucomicrobiota bacterium]